MVGTQLDRKYLSDNQKFINTRLSPVSPLGVEFSEPYLNQDSLNISIKECLVFSDFMHSPDLLINNENFLKKNGNFTLFILIILLIMERLIPLLY